MKPAESIKRKVGDKMYIVENDITMYVKIVQLPNSKGMWVLKHVFTGQIFTYTFPSEEDEE